MSTLQIDLDPTTDEALASLATARGTSPADLAAEIVAGYVRAAEPPASPDSATPDSDDPGSSWYRGPLTREAVLAFAARRYRDGPDPLDALAGSVDAEPVDDIDEVIYGR